MFELIDVYISGEQGYHTYRIPSIIKTKNGTLLAFAEGRATRKDVSEQDIVVKRSEDNGQTWSDPLVVAEDGRNSYANPCTVVENETGRIFLFLQHYPYPCKERDVVPGLEGPEICRNFVLHSDDDGKSWSEPKNITKETKRPTGATSIASGPGIGIQKRRDPHEGRIIIPYNQGPWGKWRNYMIYSDDKGDTWHMGDLIPNHPKKRGGNEIQIVELKNGSLMANSRSYGLSLFQKRNCRRTSISADGGETWSKYKDDKTLIEPRCMASIYRGSDPLDGEQSRILFSNPATKLQRKHGVVRVSYDEGKTWKHSKVIENGRFTYSCLVRMQNDTIGCFYETGVHDNHEKIVLATFDLEWLTDSSDSLRK